MTNLITPPTALALLKALKKIERNCLYHDKSYKDRAPHVLDYSLDDNDTRRLIDAELYPIYEIARAAIAAAEKEMSE